MFLRVAYIAFLIYTAVRFDICVRRRTHAFMNVPFPEQRAYYTKTFEFLDKFAGKFDIAFLRYGSDPYLLFTSDFHPDPKLGERLEIKDWTSDQIVKELTDRGYTMGDYKGKVEEMMKKIDETAAARKPANETVSESDKSAAQQKPTETKTDPKKAEQAAPKAQPQANTQAGQGQAKPQAESVKVQTQ